MRTVTPHFAAQLSLLVVLAVPPLVAGGRGQPAPAELKPGDRATLTIRWIVEDGYYLDEKTTSSLAFSAPSGITVAPRKASTKGRIIGVWEQTASIRVARDVPAGEHRVKVAAEIYFCSLREQWCRRVTRAFDLPIAVSRSAGTGPKSIELDVRVPLDEER